MRVKTRMIGLTVEEVFFYIFYSLTNSYVIAALACQYLTYARVYFILSIYSFFL